MAKFLTTASAISEIEVIINEAKEWLVLICPFVKIPENLFQSLKLADKRGKKTTLVYGKKELESDEKNRLSELDNLSSHFLENLHAKCFFNEEAMVITSFNLLNSSKENREMGVLVSAKNDPTCFKDALDEANRIVASATEDDSRKSKPTSRTRTTGRTKKGHCIRCGTIIPYDLGKPLCSDCFSEWNIYKNLDYEERFCHTCGKPEPTTIAMPRCNRCYDRSRR